MKMNWLARLVRPSALALTIVVGLAHSAALPSVARADDLTQALPTDPSLVTGQLDNGLNYVVKKHATPPGRVSLWLHISTGSLNETDAQRGIAHYLEHMAFNGSQNFAPGTVIDLFQSLGLTFGQHQNAFTSFDQTAYQLFLPDTSDEKVTKGMQFMADVATKLLLVPKEIDAEREVILREKGARSGAQQRVMEQMLDRLFPGSRIGVRLPIGTEQTINAVQREDFLDYYNRYYVPSNMTLFVVGDMEPEAMVAQVKKAFEGGEKKPIPQDLDAKVTPDAAPRAVVITDPELRRAMVQVVHVMPARAPTTTLAGARVEFIDALASGAFGRRTGNKVSAGEASYQGADAGVQTLFRAATLAMASATGEPGKWEAMLQDLSTEIVRVRQHGFTEDEITLAREEILAGLEQAASTESTAPVRAILGRMNTAVENGEPIMSAKQQLDIAKAMVPGITASEVSEAFRRMFDGNLVYYVQMPSSGDVPTEAQVLASGIKAMSADVASETETASAKVLLEKIPVAGAVAETETHESAKVWSAWLNNNVRMHHRFMDDRKDTALISIVLYGMPLRETAANAAITNAALLAWQNPATETLTSTQIRDLMTGKNVLVQGAGMSDMVKLIVAGQPKDLESGLQLAHLLLTHPKIEKPAFDRWKERTIRSIEESLVDPDGMLRRVVAQTVYPKDDSRTQPATKAQIERLTLEDAQAWLEQMIATSPIEVGVVGDISRERAVELVTTYLGSLSSHQRVTKDAFMDLRTLHFTPETRSRVEAIDTKTDKASVMVGFKGPDERDLTEARRMRLASSIITTRMINTLREKEQLVYSISAGLRPADAFPGFGLFLSQAPTEPGKADTLRARVIETYALFAQEGPTDEELKVAQGQIRNTFDEQYREPAYWLNVLDTLDYKTTTLDDVLGAPDAYAKITRDEVLETYRKWFKRDEVYSVIVKPIVHTDAPAKAE
ncbi:MAG: M16 family metallopeptidase [Phycisphaerales bacterium]